MGSDTGHRVNDDIKEKTIFCSLQCGWDFFTPRRGLNNRAFQEKIVLYNFVSSTFFPNPFRNLIPGEQFHFMERANAIKTNTKTIINENNNIQMCLYPLC